MDRQIMQCSSSSSLELTHIVICLLYNDEVRVQLYGGQFLGGVALQKLPALTFVGPHDHTYRAAHLHKDVKRGKKRDKVDSI